VEKFSHHIENLLAQHDYVVVPDFGGFVVQTQSAQVSPDKITAPVSVIGFNPLMVHGDGLLAIEIAREEKISYRLAVEYIQAEVGAIKQRIQSTGNFEFGKLGILSLNSGGIYIFSPTNKPDFLPQNFGLSDLIVYPKAKKSDDLNRKITIRLPIFRIYKYVAAALIIFGLFLFSTKLTDVKYSNTASIISFQAENQKSDDFKAQQIENNPTKLTKLVAAEPETQQKFHVIVACLQTQVAADNFCNKLIENHFAEAHVLNPVKTYRIAIQSFSDKKQAVDFMENLRKTDSRFESAWVLCE